MKTNFVNNKSAISRAVIVLVAIVIVAAVAGGIYFATTQNKPSSPSASESPTPSAVVSQSPTPVATASAAPTEAVNPSASASPTVAPSSAPTTGTSPSAAPNVTSASSLQYSVSLTADTAGALRGNYTFYGKNAGTSAFMMRIDFNVYSTPSTIILNGAQQKAWSYSDGKWSDISSEYNSYYGVWNPLWQGYVGVLAAWNGIGDYSYTLSAATVRIYDISVNPVLADSLFQHS